MNVNIVSYSKLTILRTFALIISAHPYARNAYCARNAHYTSCIARALSSNVNNNRANDHCFDDLGRSVTPIFLSMGRCLCRFSTFCEKMKKSIE